MTEKALADLTAAGYPNLIVHSVRPAFIRPTNPKDSLGFGIKAAKAVFNPLWTPKVLVIEASQLGAAMLKIAVPKGPSESALVDSKGGPGEEGVWGNTELLKLATMRD